MGRDLQVLSTKLTQRPAPTRSGAPIAVFKFREVTSRNEEPADKCAVRVVVSSKRPLSDVLCLRSTPIACSALVTCQPRHLSAQSANADDSGSPRSSTRL